MRVAVDTERARSPAGWRVERDQLKQPLKNEISMSPGKSGNVRQKAPERSSRGRCTAAREWGHFLSSTEVIKINPLGRARGASRFSMGRIVLVRRGDFFY